MVKATRRAFALPSLSITIPRSDNGRRGQAREPEPEEDYEDESADTGTPTNSEPSHKQVKFLAPEDGGDDEDAMSEQSSICQSPSWENYGQKRKEKKKEAERRKKEKEQAEKAAKVAKKRGLSRLSKAPPPPAPTSQNSRPVGLTAADRSMSDPLLVSRHLLPSTQSARPQDIGRTASADDLQQSQWNRPAVAEVLSGSTHSAAAAQNSFSPSSPSRETQSPRDAFPPSASRTPRLRRVSPSATRSNGLFQGTAGANRSQESLAVAATADGAGREGYVRYQRAQAAERAMAGLADEQLVANVGQYYPPSRSSSGHTQHTRRSSLGQDAKAAAMKLVGMKPSSAARDDDAVQTDYLSFKAIPYSASGSETSPSGGIGPELSKAIDDAFRAHIDERSPTSQPAVLDSLNGIQDSSAVERPRTAQSTAKSFAGSASSKKSRSLKDAAKAALSLSKAQDPNASSRPSSASAPPFLALRARLSSRASVQIETKPSQTAAEAASEFASVCVTVTHPRGQSTNMYQKLITAASIVDQGKEPQAGSRASEGSSSSSAFEDGSPLASPSTTPDTSRPQSAKDMPLVAGDLVKETFGLQDDERTLRQSLDSSKSSTPRTGDAEVHTAAEMGTEERWSRTALPLEIDCDAQSFMTSVSNLDEAEQALVSGALAPRGEDERVSKLQTKSAEFTISIPPRSRKRDQTPIGSPTTSSPEKRRRDDAETAHYMIGAPEEGGFAKIRESPKARTPRNYARPFQPATEPEEGHNGEAEAQAPDSPQPEWTSGSVSSAGSTSPGTLVSDFHLSSNPYFGDLTESPKYRGSAGDMVPPSPMSLPGPIHQIPPKAARANSAPALSTASAGTSRASTISARSAGAAAPVSILKPPRSLTSDPSSGSGSGSRSSVLSALPKHMQQLQAGRSAPAPGTADTRMAPIAKMLVECCNCKFYHDMPSKLYECMAKPDAVVEDKLLGISGAITTMVKCPWCTHNMSRDCCAGYAAVVYLKEKLH